MQMSAGLTSTRFPLLFVLEVSEVTCRIRAMSKKLLLVCKNRLGQAVVSYFPRVSMRVWKVGGLSSTYRLHYSHAAV